MSKEEHVTLEGRIEKERDPSKSTGWGAMVNELCLKHPHTAWRYENK